MAKSLEGNLYEFGKMFGGVFVRKRQNVGGGNDKKSTGPRMAGRRCQKRLESYRERSALSEEVGGLTNSEWSYFLSAPLFVSWIFSWAILCSLESTGSVFSAILTASMRTSEPEVASSAAFAAFAAALRAT